MVFSNLFQCLIIFSIKNMSLISNSNVVVAQLPVIGSSYAFACWVSTQYLLCLEVITKRSQGIFPASLEVTEKTILVFLLLAVPPTPFISFFTLALPGSFSNIFLDNITGTKQGSNIVFVCTYAAVGRAGSVLDLSLIFGQPVITQTHCVGHLHPDILLQELSSVLPDILLFLSHNEALEECGSTYPILPLFLGNCSAHSKWESPLSFAERQGSGTRKCCKTMPAMTLSHSSSVSFLMPM